MNFISIDDIDVNIAMVEISNISPWLSMKGKIANLFYEPSTRTSSSFWAAASELDLDVLTINNVQYSSVAKGETLEDTVRTLGSYVDAIVLRHPERGAAASAAEVSPVPIINAGDGDGEHPTQTLLDLYTIYEHFGTLNNLNIFVMGDLKYGRTVHSLVKALNKRSHIHCISPDGFELPREYGTITHSNDPLNSDLSLEMADVLYVVRTQKERFAKLDFMKMKDNCVINEEVAEVLNDKAIVMHPFPRTQELPIWFDDDPRGKYFKQMSNGLLVRKYILHKLLSND